MLKCVLIVGLFVCEAVVRRRVIVKYAGVIVCHDVGVRCWCVAVAWCGVKLYCESIASLHMLWLWARDHVWGYRHG